MKIIYELSPLNFFPFGFDVEIFDAENFEPQLF